MYYNICVYTNITKEFAYSFIAKMLGTFTTVFENILNEKLNLLLTEFFENIKGNYYIK